MLNSGNPSDCYIWCHAVALSWFRLLYISKCVKNDSSYHLLSCKLPSQNTDGNVNAPVIYCTLSSQILCPWTKKKILNGEEICSSSYDLVQRKAKNQKR